MSRNEAKTGEADLKRFRKIPRLRGVQASLKNTIADGLTPAALRSTIQTYSAADEAGKHGE